MNVQTTPWRLSVAFRSFSSSTLTRAHTSDIGKTPIKFQPSVSFDSTPTRLSVTGPLGTTTVPLEPYMTLDFPVPGTLTLSVEDAEVKKQRYMWGLMNDRELFGRY